MKKNKYDDVGAVVLAAGRGTRMKSDLPKVLHEINGKSMIHLVVSCAVSLLGRHVVVVIGHGGDLVRQAISRKFDVMFAWQKALLGTGDAVKAALPALPGGVGDVLVLCGDVPMIRRNTLADLVDFHRRESNDVSLFAVRIEDPTGYGRVILDEKGHLLAIREETDTTQAEKKNNLINSGIYCINKEFLLHAIEQIDSHNTQQEYYLTDIVGIAVASGKKAGCLLGDDPREIMGVNTLEDLRKVGACMAEKLNELS